MSVVGKVVEGVNRVLPIYPFAFQGQERDDEIRGNGNHYNMLFRVYDPRLGKFLSVDPLSPDYPWYTPYQFAGNKPIVAIDIEGLEEYIMHRFYDVDGDLSRTEIRVVTHGGGQNIDQNRPDRKNNENVVVFDHDVDGNISDPYFESDLSSKQHSFMEYAQERRLADYAPKGGKNYLNVTEKKVSIEHPKPQQTPKTELNTYKPYKASTGLSKETYDKTLLSKDAKHPDVQIVEWIGNKIDAAGPNLVDLKITLNTESKSGSHVGHVRDVIQNAFPSTSVSIDEANVGSVKKPGSSLATKQNPDDIEIKMEGRVKE